MSAPPVYAVPAVFWNISSRSASSPSRVLRSEATTEGLALPSFYSYISTLGITLYEETYELFLDVVEWDLAHHDHVFAPRSCLLDKACSWDPCRKVFHCKTGQDT